tara:strand:+ start:1447 stop:1785 length:339 start_codon:yes stop_codon:yes gene_type:complete
MEIKGKLIKKLEVESGTSKSGKEWISQTCLVDMGGEFNNIVAIKCFGEDKIKQMNKLEIDMTVNISCNVYSREYKGKYYNQIDGYWFANQTNNPEAKTNGEFVTTDDNDMPF